MKIVDQRGEVYFSQKIGALVSHAADAADLQHESAQSISSEALHQNAIQAAQEAGLDPSTKQGQAAAGAALISNTIAVALAQYERKTGKRAPRHIVQALEARFAQLLQGKKSDQERSVLPSTNILSQQELEAFPRIQQPNRGKIQSLQPQPPTPTDPSASS